MSQIRTSLSRHVETPLSDDEIGHRAHAAQAAAWHSDGIIIISLSDPTISQFVRDMIEAVGTVKFGKRLQPTTTPVRAP